MRLPLSICTSCALEESARGMRVAKVVMNWKVAIDLPRSFGSMPGSTAFYETIFILRHYEIKNPKILTACSCI